MTLLMVALIIGLGFVILAVATNVGSLLATAVIVLLTFDWTVTMVLLVAERQYPNIPALRERSLAALFISIAASGLAVMGGNVFHDWGFTTQTRLTIILAVLLVISIPAMYWLWMFVMRRF